MSLRHPLLPTVVCLICLLVLAGCTSEPNRPLNAAKEPYVLQGQAREKALDYARAIESYHRALEINPGNSVAHYRLGLLYERNDRDPAAAIYHFQRYLLLQPGSDRAALIHQRIIGCKQALAKDVALGPVSDEMQARLEELVRGSQQLAEENQRLAIENQTLKTQLARHESTPPGPISPAPTIRSTPTPPGPMVSAQTSTTYTIQQGDTYYRIANRYGVSAAALQAANPGVDPRHLRIGQQVVVPRR